MDKEKRDYNKNHPELEEGEMFLTNQEIGRFSDFARIGWKTKRTGKRAYTIWGESLKTHVPVFVQRTEYEEGMKKYE